jgi:CheY-like chemotaxis protein
MDKPDAANFPAPTILVFDDNHIKSQKLTQVLLERGYHVETAFSNAEAFTVLNQQRVNIIILDHLRPWLYGFDFCRRLKKGSGTAHIPVLLVVMLNDKLVRMRARELGITNVISRPMSDADFLQAIQETLMAEMHERD